MDQDSSGICCKDGYKGVGDIPQSSCIRRAERYAVKMDMKRDIPHG